MNNVPNAIFYLLKGDCMGLHQDYTPERYGSSRLRILDLGFRARDASQDRGESNAQGMETLNPKPTAEV